MALSIPGQITNVRSQYVKILKLKYKVICSTIQDAALTLPHPPSTPTRQQNYTGGSVGLFQVIAEPLLFRIP